MSMYADIIEGFRHVLDPEGVKKRNRERLEWNKAQFHLAEPWHDEIKWKKVLVIQASTYNPRSFFNVRTYKGININDADLDQVVVSKNKKWCYAEKQCPAALDIPLAYGRERGKAIFDGPVLIPALYQADPHGGERWLQTPWMSLTPMEMLTLRPGTKRAKGTTIVAGLGLGHQLIEVSKRPQVKKIILIERDRSLVDWILPVVRTYMGHARHSMDVIIGDAYEKMPDLTADVALVDIFPGYGGNEYGRDRLRRECPNIGFIWGWGCNAYR